MLIGEIRRAMTHEAGALADVWLRSRAAAVPSIPPPVHTDNEVREWFAAIVLPTLDVWVIDHEDRLVALMVLDDGWIDQLYVDPPSALDVSCQQRGAALPVAGRGSLAVSLPLPILR